MCQRLIVKFNFIALIFDPRPFHFVEVKKVELEKGGKGQ